MQRAVIIYNEKNFNIMKCVDSIEKSLKNQYEISRRGVRDLEVEELEEFDLIIFGSSTEGMKIFEDDFISLYNSLAEADLDLSNKRGAAFCPIDKGGPMFCEVVDIFQDELENYGVDFAVTGFKWNGEVDQLAEEEIQSWIKSLTKV